MCPPHTCTPSSGLSPSSENKLSHLPVLQCPAPLQSQICLCPSFSPYSVFKNFLYSSLNPQDSINSQICSHSYLELHVTKSINPPWCPWSGPLHSPWKPPLHPGCWLGAPPRNSLAASWPLCPAFSIQLLQANSQPAPAGHFPVSSLAQVSLPHDLRHPLAQDSPCPVS
jgi:hypothetical protein